MMHDDRIPDGQARVALPLGNSSILGPGRGQELQLPGRIPANPNGAREAYYKTLTSDQALALAKLMLEDKDVTLAMLKGHFQLMPSDSPLFAAFKAAEQLATSKDGLFVWVNNFLQAKP